MQLHRLDVGPVSAIPVNTVLLQEVNRLIGIEMLTSDFLTFFGS